jgi:hypothetical protein
MMCVLSNSSPERGGGSPLGLTEGPLGTRRTASIARPAKPDPSTTRRKRRAVPLPVPGRNLGAQNLLGISLEGSVG